MFKKFRKWMRYNPPAYATVDEWVEFDNYFRKNAPIRFFITTGTGKKFLRYIKFKITRSFNWINYRTFEIYHKVDTGLTPGYRGVSERMLHANFTLLVDYVERVLALRYAWLHQERQNHLYRNSNWVPDILKKYIKMDADCAIQYALNYLQKEIETESDELNVDRIHSMKEVRELYLWWTIHRKERKLPECPIDFSKHKNDHIFLFSTEKWKLENPDLHSKWQEYCEEVNRLESEWYKEDYDNLLRLVKIQPFL